MSNPNRKKEQENRKDIAVTDSMNTMLSKKIPQDITRRLFSSITDKEVVEAVKHVHEREKKVRAPKLDRTRVLIAYHDSFLSLSYNTGLPDWQELFLLCSGAE